MSCEKNASLVSKTAGVNTGIHALQSKFSGVSGRMVDAVTGTIGRSATAALFVIESFEGPKTLDAIIVPVATLTEAAAHLWVLQSRSPGPQPETKEIKLNRAPSRVGEVEEDIPGWVGQWYMDRQERIGYNDEPTEKYEKPKKSGDKPPKSTIPLVKAQPYDRTADTLRKRMLMALGLLKLSQTGSAFLGTGVARMSRQKKIGVVDGVEQRFFFTNTTKLPVTVWRSSLTPMLNLMDSGLSKVTSSDGIMFELNGKTWHRGTVVVKTAQGERTITHLQSLSSPATHYYFSRRLDDNEAVGIVAGQKGFDPKHLPDRGGNPATGYAGQISEVEELLPVWAMLKRRLIQTHLRWGSIPNRRSGEPNPPLQVEQVSLVSLAEPANTGSAPTVTNNRSKKDERGGGTRGKRGKRPSQLSDAPDEPSSPKVGADIHPLDNIGPRITLGDKEYKVMVRRINPATADQPSLAEATYYDDEDRVWKELKDPVAREKLAAQVEAGLLQPWDELEMTTTK